MNQDDTIIISDSESDVDQNYLLKVDALSIQFETTGDTPKDNYSPDESDEEFQRDLQLAKELSLQSLYADGYEVDDEASASSDCSITMTTGTQTKLKQSSVKEESDNDLPKIRIPLSRQSSQSRQEDTGKQISNHKSDKKKTHGEYYHQEDRENKSAGDNVSKRDKKKNNNDENLPKALKPLKPILSDGSLSDLSDHTNSSGCNKENGKRNRHIRTKHSVHEEWKKYIPPLFSVAADVDDMKAESYGEKTRNLYSKLNDGLTRNTRKHKLLYKTHNLVKRESDMREKKERESLAKGRPKNSRKNSKPSHGIKVRSPKKSRLLKGRIETLKSKSKKEEKHHAVKKMCEGDGFSDSGRNRDNRMRTYSEQSESSICTADGNSSCPLSVSKNKSDTELVEDSDVGIDIQSFVDSDQSGDELDKINANILKRREKSKIRKRNKSFDQLRNSESMKPVQRSFSFVVKQKIQPHDKNILEILEKEISESDYSIKSEKEDRDSEFSESSYSQNSPSSCLDKEKLKLHFQSFRNSLEKLERHPGFITPEKEFFYSDIKLSSLTGDAIKKEDKHSASAVKVGISPLEGKEIKQQIQIFRQKFKSSFQKENIKSEVNQKNEMPKINRHFLDVLDYEKREESEMDGIKSEKEEIKESPLSKTGLKNEISLHKTGTWPSIFQTEIKNEKSQELIISDCNSEINEESPLPVIELKHKRHSTLTSTDVIQTEERTQKKSDQMMDDYISKAAEASVHKNLMVGNNHLDALLHKAQKKYVNNLGPELNPVQAKVVTEWPIHSLDLSKTNFYASAVPIHKVNLRETELYMSELPLLKIDLKAANISLDKYVDESDSDSRPLTPQDIKNQPKITDFFTNKECSDSIADKYPVVFDRTPDVREPNAKYETKPAAIHVRDCSVLLEPLAMDLSPYIADVDEEEKNINLNTDEVSNNFFQRKSGRKRKVKCQRLLSQKSLPSSCPAFLSLSQHTVVDSGIVSCDRLMKQLECFMQDARIDHELGLAEVSLPESHSNMIHACVEEGCVNLKHNLEFLNWFCNHYKPQTHIMTQIIETAFLHEVSIEGVNETFHLLQKVNSRYPGQIRFEWKTIEHCLNILIVKRLSGEASELSVLQASLLLKLIIQVLKLDLYSKDLNAQSEIRKSLAYRLLSGDVHSPYPKDMIGYLALLITDSRLEGLLNPAGDKDVFVAVNGQVQELLTLAVEVSSSCVSMASHLAEEFKKLYNGLSKVSDRSLLLNSIRSDLVRYKLAELILESEYSGTWSLPARFPDSVTQIISCFAKAVPLKLGHQPACDLLDNVDDDRVLEYSVSDCEEIAMLMYYALVSYLECCKRKISQSLRSRVEYCSSKELATYKIKDEWTQFLEYVDDFLDHLLSLNSNLSPATEHYILLMQCLSDLNE